MKILNSYILFMLLAFSCNNNQQIKIHDVVVFKYESTINDELLNKFNFSSKRKYINDSVFDDYAILCQSDTATCRLRFYVKNGNWYIWNGQTFSLFYSQSTKLIKDQRLKYCEKQLKVYSDSTHSIFSNLNSFKIYDDNDYSGQSNVYYFEPYCGVIGISSSNVTLVRSDYKRNNLLK